MLIKNRQDVKDSTDLLPMTSAVFYVLLALAEGEKHGYAIMQQVEALSNATFRMGPGTLYTTLQRLLAMGVIEEVQSNEGDDSRRRCYRIKRWGIELLQEEIRRMESAVLFVRQNRLVPDAK